MKKGKEKLWQVREELVEDKDKNEDEEKDDNKMHTRKAKA
jgi:hypothetical protein